ncbi:MAG TPA: hypothetical protein VN922_05745, partial [Bacteroidia bacterium]|nr:hypothetical protein [Bacteroidia bacterium]
MRRLALVLFVLIAVCGYSQSRTDSTIKKDDALKIFLDCSYCDMDFLRCEIPIVHYVRDRKEANVDIVASAIQTGSGGEEFTLVFIGQGKYKGQTDTLRTNTTSFVTEEDQRKAIAQILKMGLIRYIAQTPYAGKLNISFTKDSAQAMSCLAPPADKWKSWVFSVNLGGNLNQQQLTQQTIFTPSLNISKVTPEWKVGINASGFYMNNTYTISGETINAIMRTEALTGFYVKSLGEHFSTGVVGGVNTSTVSNFKLQEKIGPAIEYSIFPYSECTHRQLRLLYAIYGVNNNYVGTTIFGKINQHLGAEALTLYSQYKEKWGSLTAQITGSHYFYDVTKYEVNMNVNANINLFEGFSIGFYVSLSLIHDQIYLPAAGPTDNDILLGLQALATTYNFSSGIQITYTFGSIYNNIVNPRFNLQFPY